MKMLVALPLSIKKRISRGIYKFVQASYRYMSDQGSTHLERTASLPRETITAVGKVVHVTSLSETVKGISIHVPDTRFKFKAGQWVDFEIPGIETIGGFSMCSSPEKLQKHRLVDLAIKRSDHPPAHWVHTQCQVGSQVTLKVGGDFFYDPLTKKAKELLLVAGGVGINPLHSIIQELFESLEERRLAVDDIKVSLLYSASSLDELIFKNDLCTMSRTYPNIECQFFVTRDCPMIGHDKSFQIYSERITSVVLQETIKRFSKKSPTVLVCGPSPMIDFVTTTLETFGVDKENIKTEKWW